MALVKLVSRICSTAEFQKEVQLLQDMTDIAKLP
jgi:hypothetical protein